MLNVARNCGEGKDCAGDTWVRTAENSQGAWKRQQCVGRWSQCAENALGQPARQRRQYEHGPSTEWQSIYPEANALLGEDPGSDAALALAGRWLEQLDRDTGGDPRF